MKKSTFKKVMYSLTALLFFSVVSAVGFISYLYVALPQYSEVPKAPVLALPQDFDPNQPVYAYDGEHPRVAGRPEETFDFPIRIGEVGPSETLYARDVRYPFLCGENKHSDLQPLVDNQDGVGVPVFAVNDDEELTDEIVGYSKDCLHPTFASYYYNRVDTEEFYPLEEADNDIEKIVVNGREIDFVVRLETGTINRYHYAIAVLRGDEENIAFPSGENWNQKLIYQFRGGVGIGKRQGKIRKGHVLSRRFEEIKQGYAVAYSSANQTSNHYNMWLAEEMVRRVKSQFVGLYGEPEYTVGVGGSGGAIQQYLIAQNHPGLLDILIPLYSYPDMVTQTTYVLDCEPLQHYFDHTAANNPMWQDWEKRQWIEGLNGDNEAKNRFNQLASLARLMQGEAPELKSGASECIRGWRGLTPLVHNPNFVHFINSFAPEVGEQVHWTHWEDLKYFYGYGDTGFANSTWDNVGVQYGLQALRDGLIGVEDFIHLNRNVGGWQYPLGMKDEELWLLEGQLFPVNLALSSQQNMSLSRDGETPAKRVQGSMDAMAGAYRSGHVFIGYAEVPIIDVRHYLENDLDMHHLTASFSTRLRLEAGQGYSDNQVIWVTDKKFDARPLAFAMADEWMRQIRQHPERSVAENKPQVLSDSCFDGEGKVIAQGKQVWDGDWNQRADGACMKVYPRYKTPREVAGGNVEGDIFKCHLQPVEQAVEAGVYGDLDMSHWLDQLKNVFPTGVCDYRLGDAGRPVALLNQRTPEIELSTTAPAITAPSQIAPEADRREKKAVQTLSRYDQP